MHWKDKKTIRYVRSEEKGNDNEGRKDQQGHPDDELWTSWKRVKVVPAKPKKTDVE